MKHFFLICLALLMFAGHSYAQCDQAFIDKCSSANGAAVKYVKHFRIRFTEAMKGKSVSEGKFSVMLSKGSHYRFYVCNDESKPGHTVVEVTPQEKLAATSTRPPAPNIRHLTIFAKKQAPTT